MLEISIDVSMAGSLAGGAGAGLIGPGAGVDDLLLESGDHLLLESGDAILLE